MATRVTNYQCPACTAPLHFTGESGKLECDYCGSQFEVAEIEALYAKKDEKAEQAYAEAEEKARKASWDASELSEDWGENGEHIRAYNCPSCGARLLCDDTTAATSCPYCGNPSIVPGSLSGTLKPDYVLPFKLSQDKAKQALKNFYQGKVFLPGSFKTENKISQIRGIYVPFWLFDGDADVNVRFDATRTHTYREGEYDVTETAHYVVNRSGIVRFSKIPVDASSKMPDAYMDGLEPFQYQDLQKFSNAYLPGYLADKYDVSTEDCAPRADERAKNTAIEAMRRDVMGYDTCVMTREDTNLHRGKVHYALLPVYILNTKWKGQDYLFAMNGQTGKIVGKLPVSWGKFWGWFAGITVPVGLILGTVIHLFF